MLPNYTLDEFYTKFLDDDAPCSLEVFQRTVIKDENIQLSPWNKVSPFTTPSSPSSSTNTDDIEETMTRTLSFLHLRKSSKIGPSTAQTTRQQICSKFGPSGVVLHTTTKLDGVPYSDCFLVEEEWIIEPLQREEGGGGIQLSVRLKVTFVKSTVMKKIISKQSKEEVKKWYNLYLPYLSSGDKLTDNIEVDRQDENIRENVDVSLDYHPWISSPYTIFVVVLFAIAVFHIYSLNGKVKELEVLIHELISDTKKLHDRITLQEEDAMLQSH